MTTGDPTGRDVQDVPVSVRTLPAVPDVTPSTVKPSDDVMRAVPCPRKVLPVPPCAIVSGGVSAVSWVMSALIPTFAQNEFMKLMMLLRSAITCVASAVVLFTCVKGLGGTFGMINSWLIV